MSHFVQRQFHVLIDVIVIIICFIGIPIPMLWAQNSTVKFEWFPSLENEMIECLYQDPLGLLWIGTWDGLYRYDGAGLKRYLTNTFDDTSISGDMILAIAQDHNGFMWFGTQNNGLSRYDPATDSFQQYKHDPENPNSLSFNSVTEVFEDSSYRLWVGTWGKGLDLLDRETMTFRHYDNDPNCAKYACFFI